MRRLETFQGFRALLKEVEYGNENPCYTKCLQFGNTRGRMENGHSFKVLCVFVIVL